MTTLITNRVYYAPHPSETGEFIAIQHAMTGYYPSTVYTQDHADTLNERQGITRAEVAAAVTCSMFDCWHNFAKIAANLEDKQ